MNDMKLNRNIYLYEVNHIFFYHENYFINKKQVSDQKAGRAGNKWG